MNDISCKAIADILPLYAENMVSDDTRALVETHLENCETCRLALAALQTKPALPQDDGQMLKKLHKKLLFQKVKMAAIACAVLVVLLSLWGTYRNAPISLSAAEAIVSVKPSEEEGLLSVLISPAVADYSIQYGADNTLFLTAWTTAAHQSRNRAAYWETHIPVEHFVAPVAVGQSQTSPQTTIEPPCRVYYYSIKNPDRMDVLLYKSPNMPKADYDGVQTLPRLVLNYYFIIAAVLAAGCALLMIVLFIARRRKSARLMMHITLVPACYALSSMLILHGRSDVYNVEYYLSAILIIAILMYLVVRFVMYLFTRPE